MHFEVLCSSTEKNRRSGRRHSFFQHFFSRKLDSILVCFEAIVQRLPLHMVRYHEDDRWACIQTSGLDYVDPLTTSCIPCYAYRILELGMGIFVELNTARCQGAFRQVPGVNVSEMLSL